MILISFKKYLSFLFVTCEKHKSEQNFHRRKTKKTHRVEVSHLIFQRRIIMFSSPRMRQADDAARENLRIFSFSFAVMVSLVHIYALISRNEGEFSMS
jgi:hypothetical protein